jgi:hypothetical protein
MTTANEIYGSALRILRAAAHYPTFRPIYEETCESVRGLADNGYLEPLSTGEYQITEKGLAYLSLTADAKPRRRASQIDDIPLPRRKRRSAQKPQPQAMQKVLQRVRFNDLRRRQKDILRFIDHHVKQMGFPPTYREIGQEVGTRNVSVVMYNVDQLVAWGWLHRTEGVSRSLCLARDLPGQKTSSEMYESRGVLKITLNLASKSNDVIAAAQAAIERLQQVIATTQADERGA